MRSLVLVFILGVPSLSLRAAWRLRPLAAVQLPLNDESQGFPTLASPNVPLDTVKNLRDLASVRNANIQPHRLVRMGYPSHATAADMETLRGDLRLKTLIDLRSDKELFMDEKVDCAPYYEDFESFRRCRVTQQWFRFCMEEVPEQSSSSDKEALGKKAVRKAAKKIKSKMVKRGAKPVPVADPTQEPATHPQRLMISVMDENTYKMGVLTRLRKRHKAAFMGLLLGGIFSKRMYGRARELVLEYVNQGGLPLLNDLLLTSSGKELAMILKIAADKSRHPIGLYCTAGKDRTGLIVMLMLAAIGVDDESLLNDYVLSDSAYKVRCGSPGRCSTGHLPERH